MNIIQGGDYLKMNNNKMADTNTVSSDLFESMNKSVVEGFSSCKKTQKYPSNIPDRVIEKNSYSKGGTGFELGSGELSAKDANTSDSDRYNELTDELMRLLAIYKGIHGQLVTATDKYLGDSDVDKNVYAGFIDDFEGEIKYEGCFKDSGNRAIPNLQRQRGGYYTFNMKECAQRAWDKGHTVFGLQNIQGNDVNRSTCMTGTDLQRAKKYGIGIEYYWTWAGVQRQGWGYTNNRDLKLQLFSKGNLVSYTGKVADSEEDFIQTSGYKWWIGWTSNYRTKGGRTVYGQTNTDKFSFYRWYGWYRRGRQYYGGGRVNYLDRQWVGRDFWWTGLSAVRLSRPTWWSINYWIRSSGSKAVIKHHKDKSTKWIPTESNSNRWDTRNLEDIPIKCDDGYVLQGYKLNMSYGQRKTSGYYKEANRDHGGYDFGYFRNWSINQCKSWCDKRSNCRGFNLGKNGKGCWIKYGISGGRNTNRLDFYHRQVRRTSIMNHWHRCAKWEGALQCRQAATNWNDSGNGNSVYMDRHGIYCNENENIGEISMENSDDKKKYRFNYSCCKNTNPSGCYMIIQDDGNLVIYKGTGPKDRKGVIWSSNTQGRKGNKRIQEWLDKRKNGRNYIRSGEYLASNEFIASDSGMVRAHLQPNGNFVVRQAISRCKKGSDGNVYGKWFGNAVYTIPKNNVDDLNKSVYIDKENNVKTIPNNMLEGGMEFVKLANTNAWGNDIRSFEIKDDGARYGAYDCQSYLNRYSDLQKSFGTSCTDPDTASKAKEHWDNYGKREGRLAGKSTADPYEAKKACIEDPRCSSFVIQNGRCFLKNNNSFPKGDRQIEQGSDLYIRSKNANNDSSCTSEVKAVSTTEFSAMMKGLANGGRPTSTINRNTPCGLKRDTTDERKNLEGKGHEVELKIDAILAEMNNLTKVAQKYMAEKPLMKQKVSSMIEEYNKSFKTIKKYRKSKDLLNQYEQGTDLLMTSHNYNYVLWSVGAIAVLIAVIQIMKKRN
jgi:hypothetical protein